ncbi:transmembrane protein 45B-like isoform X1 [Portunus trituberculatus]|uniref:transmembrane protein 45B-like isoform X1 n=2 Tax=Portunus trituberculatus TaxID=210409 RepID=UPI001E1CEE05|nr:transmembrane protein 45B-like isoform X1 [Portunus trituberculatus]
MRGKTEARFSVFPFHSTHLSSYTTKKSHLNRAKKHQQHQHLSPLQWTPASAAMGSFIGHVVPGSFFGLFGAWYVYQVFLKYFMCQRAAVALGEKGRSFYQNTSSFVCSCCPTMPLEGFLKIAASVLGMIGEVATGFDETNTMHLGNAQHTTMFFFFGLHGAAEVMLHYRLAAPPDLDFLSGALAFGMEALLFFYHLHGRTAMDVQVHTLLFFVVVACAVSVVLEMCYKDNVVPALCRAYFILLQGTWFYQIGFILYPPVGRAWSQEDHRQMMLVTLLFAWHNATVFVAMVLTGTLVYLRVKAMAPSCLYHRLHHHLKAPTQPHLTHLEAEPSKAMLLSEDEEV